MADKIVDRRIVAHDVAESIAGRRLDKRRIYAVIGGGVCGIVRWTGPCSGCTTEGIEHIGSGCRECGWTGKRSREMWMPMEQIECAEVSNA